MSIRLKIKLDVNISNDEVTISMEDGTEIVHWVKDEWEEDPTVTPCIAVAIKMAYNDPERLIEINRVHIDSQRRINDDTRS